MSRARRRRLARHRRVRGKAFRALTGALARQQGVLEGAIDKNLFPGPLFEAKAR